MGMEKGSPSAKRCRITAAEDVNKDAQNQSEAAGVESAPIRKSKTRSDWDFLDNLIPKELLSSPVCQMEIDSPIPTKCRRSIKKPRNTAPTTSTTPKEEHKSTASTPNGDVKVESSGPLSVTLADPDLLDCPVCFQPLCSPVYQCENGHIACGSCCPTILKNKCSSCCLPIGNIRNRAVEQILESVRVTCQYMPYGCAEMFSYTKKVAHEKACNYVPCSCPCIGCDFVGISKPLYDHFASKHMDSSKQFCFNSMFCILMGSTEKHVVLRESEGGELFVLHRYIDTLGSYCNVACVAPSASEKRFMYELSVYSGEDSFKVKTSVEMISKWTPQPPAKMTLLVPSNLVSTTQVLKLFLIITKKHARAN